MCRLLHAAFVTTVLIAMAMPPLMRGANAQTSTPVTTTSKKASNASQVALRERQRKCGAEWKAAKVAGKVEKGMKWPQYWSACNKRLKSGS